MGGASRLCWELAKASVWGQTSLMHKHSLIFRALHFKANDPVVSAQGKPRRARRWDRSADPPPPEDASAAAELHGSTFAPANLFPFWNSLSSKGTTFQ